MSILKRKNVVHKILKRIPSALQISCVPSNVEVYNMKRNETEWKNKKEERE